MEKNGYQKVVKSGEAIRDELGSFKELDAGLITKTLGITYPDYPYYQNYYRMVEAKGGKFKAVGDWIASDRIKGSLD